MLLMPYPIKLWGKARAHNGKRKPEHNMQSSSLDLQSPKEEDMSAVNTSLLTRRFQLEVQL